MAAEWINWFRIKIPGYFTPRRMLSFLCRRGVRAAIIRAKPFLRQIYHEATFDLKYGVSTRKIVPVDRLGIDDRRQHLAYRYRPSHVLSVVEALNIVKGFLPDPENGILVDYGCGAGRVMILAAEAGFGRVIGIEFSPLMAELCRKNIATYELRRGYRTEFTILEQDAATYDPPSDARVFFFYSPFNWELYEPVLDRIEKSIARAPRTAYILDVTLRNRANFSGREYRRVASFDDGTGEIVDIYML